MKSTMLLVLIFVASSVSPALGQTIQLRRSGVAGYMYTVNGRDFAKIGTRDSGLTTVLKDDSLAQSQLNRYFSGKSAGQFTALLGIAMLSYGGYSTAAEMDDGEINPLLFVGAGICVAGVVQIVAANRHLIGSVRTYNKHIEKAATKPSAEIMAYPDAGGAMVYICIRF